jgi:hypothetical protein
VRALVCTYIIQTNAHVFVDLGMESKGLCKQACVNSKSETKPRLGVNVVTTVFGEFEKQLGINWQSKFISMLTFL